MSRTFRCKSTAPTGTIVRDGDNSRCYNNLGMEYYAKYFGSTFETTVQISQCHGQLNIFGFTDVTDFLDGQARIFRTLPKWYSIPSYKRHRRNVKTSKSIERRNFRRTNKLVLEKILKQPTVEDFDYEFVRAPTRKFRFK